MLDQVFRSAQDALAIKGVRRALWFFLVLTVFLAFFETETNYFELNSISKRLDVLERINKQQLSLEQTARMEKVKSDILNEFEIVQAKRANEVGQFTSLVWRFVKGAWITFPLFLIPSAFGYFAFKGAKNEGLRGQTMALQIWVLGVSCVIWVATLLGVVSMLLNTSSSFFISWIVFPICSAVIITAIALWIALLRALLPSEEKKNES